MKLAAVALSALAYSHGRTETVWATEGKHGPFRVNKSDFDIDQQSDKPRYKASDGPNSEPSTEGVTSDVNVTHTNGVQTTAAPSAPDFSNNSEGTTPPTDEVKQAAAPTATTIDQLLVMKQGTGKSAKFFITDGMGQKIEGDRAKLLGIDEKGYDTEEAAKQVQSTTEPSKAPAN